MQTKVCKTCNNEYPATTKFFHKDSTGKYGLKANCKICINGNKYKFVTIGNYLCKSCGREFPYTEKYFVINKKSGNLTSPCRECRGLTFKIPIKRNSIKITKEKKKKIIPFTNIDEKYCCRCKTIKKKTQFYKDNSKKDKLSTICKACRKNYNILNRSKRAKYVREKRNNNLKDKIINILRCRISAALSGKVKSESTRKLLGCSVDEFIKYIENKMSILMTWENYGSYWHIDHIIPCKYFNLINIDDQQKCFNYKNMQPMFAKDNLEKQGYSKINVVYKTSFNYKINKYNVNENTIIDER